MVLKKMGRRKFIKNISSAILGVVGSRFWYADPSFAKTEKMPTLEYRTLERPGLKVDAWG